MSNLKKKVVTRKGGSRIVQPEPKKRSAKKAPAKVKETGHE